MLAILQFVRACVCVCVCVCVYTHIHIYIYIYIYMSITRGIFTYIENII